MSDNQIRDLFASAEEWSPEDDADNAAASTTDGVDSATKGTDSATGSGNSTPNTTRPTLRIGSDVEIANSVAQVLQQQHGEVVFAEGSFWYYAGSHWHSMEDHELRLVVHQFDGATAPGGGAVKLNKTRVDSIIHEMTALLARPAFFSDARVGINCRSGFISFSPEGVPTLEKHSPEHRCRSILKGNWYVGSATKPLQEVFAIFKAVDNFLLLRLLEGVFLGDEDAKEKQALLAEIAGAVALGYGTKLMQPRAVILEGKTAENGKSQILDLFRDPMASG